MRRGRAHDVTPDLVHLRRRLVAWAAADEFVPLYAVYALLFEDAGLTAASISIAFMAWSATVVVLEVPSGALADRVSRRRLLATATLLRAVGFATWLVLPGLSGVVVGFVLWGASGAAASGTWQALTWDELARIGATDAYTAVTARMAQAQGLAIAVSMLTAAPLVAVVGIRGVAVVSIGQHVLTLLLVVRLPEVRAVRGVEEPTGWRGWAQTLRSGVRTATRTPVLARLAVLGAVLEVVTVVEEYVPLLARDLGATDTAVPLLAVLPWLGNLLGAEVAARRPGLAPWAAAGIVVFGAGSLATGIASDVPLGIVGVGVM
jgi:MFS family permease